MEWLGRDLPGREHLQYELTEVDVAAAISSDVEDETRLGKSAQDPTELGHDATDVAGGRGKGLQANVPERARRSRDLAKAREYVGKQTRIRRRRGGRGAPAQLLALFEVGVCLLFDPDGLRIENELAGAIEQQTFQIQADRPCRSGTFAQARQQRRAVGQIDDFPIEPRIVCLDTVRVCQVDPVLVRR
jgi:hypothetical protein